MVEKVFFNASMPRSGSTLIQNILAQNPDIYPTPTSPLSDYILNAREVYSNNPNVLAQDEGLMKKSFRNLCKSALKSYFEPLTDRKYAFDKSRAWKSNYSFLSFIMGEEPKMICVVRDLRDVFCSNEKNFRKNPHKAKSLLVGDMSTLLKRVDTWSMSQNFVGDSIDSLMDAIRTGNDKKMLFIKYENLCLYPEKAMERVYDYLELPRFKHDFDNVEQFTQEDDKIHGIFGVHDIRNTVEMLPSDAIQILGKDVCDLIYNNYKWFYDYFGYPY